MAGLIQTHRSRKIRRFPRVCGMLAFAATSSLVTWAVVLVPATPACAEILMPAAAHSPALPSKEDIVSHPASTPSHPSPPQVLPIEHGGVRYEQDTARQTRPDAERGGWLVAKDAANGKQLWSVQLYTNPYDAGSPVGNPPRCSTDASYSGSRCYRNRRRHRHNIPGGSRHPWRHRTEKPLIESVSARRRQATTI